MSRKSSVAVCRPSASSIPGQAVFIHFEVMDPDTFKSTGGAHDIAMTSMDAVQLLGLLEAMSQKYDWPKAPAPAEFHIPPNKQRN